MLATVCERCLTVDLEMVVCLEGERCRRCGHQPIRGALTPKEIQACVLAKKERDDARSVG
jgi:hypothetical protein